MNAIALAIVATVRAAFARQTLRLARRAGSPTVRQNLRTLARFVRPCSGGCPAKSVALAAMTLPLMASGGDAYSVTVVPSIVAVGNNLAGANEVAADAKPDATTGTATGDTVTPVPGQPSSPLFAKRSGALQPTKTHKSRTWVFEPSADRTQPGLGTLTIVQGKEADAYGFDIIDGEALFAKLDASGDVYGVRLTDGKPTRCTCLGYSRHKTCKHADATRELLAS